MTSNNFVHNFTKHKNFFLITKNIKQDKYIIPTASVVSFWSSVYWY